MRTETITDSKSVNPSSNHYDSAEVYSVSNVTRGYTEADSTTYATIYLARGVSAETYMYFDFASDLVPSGATINSLTCQAKAYISTTQTSTLLSGQRKMQMFANGVGKGTEITVTTSTSTISTLSNNTDSWTAQEVNNLSIRLYAKRSTNANNANSTTNFRFYGATLTVNYTYNQVVYEVAAVSNVSGVLMSPSRADIVAGGGRTFDILGDLTNVIIEDNGIDVTSQLEPQAGGSVSATYSLTNVSEDHFIHFYLRGNKIFVKRNGNWVEASDIKVKVNGTWQSVNKAYKKANGAWEEQDKSAMFDPNALYLKG